MKQARKIAVIGAGWAGLAAAITATQQGHKVCVFEASRHWGGRARSLTVQGQDALVLDTALASMDAAIDLLTQLCNMGCIAFGGED